MVNGFDRINQEIEVQLDEWYVADGEVLSSREERRNVWIHERRLLLHNHPGNRSSHPALGFALSST